MVWYGLVGYCMIWYDMLWYGMVWYDMVCYHVVYYCMILYGMLWHGMVWNSYDMVWYGMVWYGVVWCGMIGVIHWICLLSEGHSKVRIRPAVMSPGQYVRLIGISKLDNLPVKSLQITGTMSAGLIEGNRKLGWTFSYHQERFLPQSAEERLSVHTLRGGSLCLHPILCYSGGKKKVVLL